MLTALCLALNYKSPKKAHSCLLKTLVQALLNKNGNYNQFKKKMISASGWVLQPPSVLTCYWVLPADLSVMNLKSLSSSSREAFIKATLREARRSKSSTITGKPAPQLEISDLNSVEPIHAVSLQPEQWTSCSMTEEVAGNWLERPEQTVWWWNQTKWFDRHQINISIDSHTL